MITHAEYEEAVALIDKVERMKALQVSLLDKQTDGDLCNAGDYDLACGVIKEAIDDLYYEKIFSANATIEAFNRARTLAVRRELTLPEYS